MCVGHEKGKERGRGTEKVVEHTVTTGWGEAGERREEKGKAVGEQRRTKYNDIGLKMKYSFVC